MNRIGDGLVVLGEQDNGLVGHKTPICQNLSR